MRHAKEHGQPRAGMVKIIGTSCLGTLLEYYDFFVYVALTSVLTRLFLPSTSALNASLLGAATFGIAYVARPVGTLIFSPLSDRVGRKKTFVITLAIMGVATFAIGCLPTYAAAGVAAPLALLTLRIVQGIALGGEYGSAVVYVMEHAPSGRKGAYTSTLQSTASLGLLLALGIVAVLRVSLDAASFDAWGWRVPFLVSAPIVLVATWIRLGMQETEVFLEMQRKGALSASPLADAMGNRQSWKAILLAVFGAQGSTSVSLYTSIVYMLYFLQQVLKVEQGTANLCLAGAILVAAPAYPLAGRLSDAIGRARVMLIGIVLWICAAYPVFSAIRNSAMQESWVVVSALIAILAVLTAMIMAPLPAFIAECFPPQSRTTGFGLSQQIGNILFGGFLPLISLALVERTGNQLAGVAYSIASLLPCLIVTWLWGLKKDAAARRGSSSQPALAPMPGSPAPHEH